MKHRAMLGTMAAVCVFPFGCDGTPTTTHFQGTVNTGDPEHPATFEGTATTEGDPGAADLGNILGQVVGGIALAALGITIRKAG